MPTSACLRTISDTPSLKLSAKLSRSSGSWLTLARMASLISSGRVRLPTRVVRILSVLRFCGMSGLLLVALLGFPARLCQLAVRFFGKAEIVGAFDGHFLGGFEDFANDVEIVSLRFFVDHAVGRKSSDHAVV